MPSTIKYVNGPIIMFAVGCFCVIGSIIWYYVGDYTVPAFADQSVAQNNPPVNQNNQSGPNINAPGGKFNFYHGPPPEITSETGTIYQAGVEVGKVFGARRSPNDATTFEFVEITNANQFNPNEEFEFQDCILRFQSTRIRVRLDVMRPQAGMIYGYLVAKVIRKK